MADFQHMQLFVYKPLATLCAAGTVCHHHMLLIVSYALGKRVWKIEPEIGLYALRIGKHLRVQL